MTSLNSRAGPGSYYKQMKSSLSQLFLLPLLAAMAALLMVLTLSQPASAPSAAGVSHLPADSLEPIVPLPSEVGDVLPQRAALGARLFHDPRLSIDGTISCASCHPLPHGTDGRIRSLGVGGVPSERNTPSVLNAALNFTQFWDGRASTLAEQIRGPLLDPREMASNWTHIETSLRADAEYTQAFKLAYDGAIDRHSITNALASYLQTLLTPDAPFDRYLRGETAAINADARRGYELFKSHGCASCHQGVGVGGNLFQRLGVITDYFADHPDNAADTGRQRITGREEDRHVFKVPSLRNVALTAPYLHDGSVAQLPDAVRIMGRYQLGRPLSDEEIRLIVAFLNTLTGKLPEAQLTAQLP